MGTMEEFEIGCEESEMRGGKKNKGRIGFGFCIGSGRKYGWVIWSVG